MMTRGCWLTAVALGALFAGSGCVTCCHQAAKASLEAGPNCESPARDRRHVYAVLVNGLTPGTSYGLEGLRDHLAGHGFAKVYYGQLAHAGWLGREIKKVRAEDPSARFVVVGYDAGCPTATTLAWDAAASGMAVDALVLIDPIGTVGDAACPVRTVLIQCGRGTGGSHAERVSIPGANHFTLPTHPWTVELVCGLLKESATRVEHPGEYEIVDPGYEHAPPLRPVLPPGPDVAPEWLFLHEDPGYQPAPLSPIPQMLPAPIAPALIPRGGYAPPPDLPRPQPVPLVVPLPTPRPGQPLPLPLPKVFEEGP